MKKIGIILICLISFLLFSTLTPAKNDPPPTHKLVQIKTDYVHDTLKITNFSNDPINLQHAELEFYYSGKITTIEGVNKLKIKPSITMQNHLQQPMSAGNYYRIKLEEINQAMLPPKQSIQFRLMTDKKICLMDLDC